MGSEMCIRDSIWMGMYLDWAFRSLCFFVRFVRGKWLEQQVI